MVIRRADFVRSLVPIRLPQTLSAVPERVWTFEDWAVIRAGLRAASMDERWDAVVEEQRLYFFRSWTGYGIVEAQFEERPDGWAITSVVVEGDPDRYRRGTDELESLHLVQLIEAVFFQRRDEELSARVALLRSASGEES